MPFDENRNAPNFQKFTASTFPATRAGLRGSNKSVNFRQRPVQVLTKVLTVFYADGQSEDAVPGVSAV
jgi:hypothetical protein